MENKKENKKRPNDFDPNDFDPNDFDPYTKVGKKPNISPHQLPQTQQTQQLQQLQKEPPLSLPPPPLSLSLPPPPLSLPPPPQTQQTQLLPLPPPPPKVLSERRKEIMRMKSKLYNCFHGIIHCPLPLLTFNDKNNLINYKRYKNKIEGYYLEVLQILTLLKGLYVKETDIIEEDLSLKSILYQYSEGYTKNDVLTIEESIEESTEPFKKPSFKKTFIKSVNVLKRLYARTTNSQDMITSPSSSIVSLPDSVSSSVSSKHPIPNVGRSRSHDVRYETETKKISEKKEFIDTITSYYTEQLKHHTKPNTKFLFETKLTEQHIIPDKVIFGSIKWSNFDIKKSDKDFSVQLFDYPKNHSEEDLEILTNLFTLMGESTISENFKNLYTSKKLSFVPFMRDCLEPNNLCIKTTIKYPTHPVIEIEISGIGKVGETTLIGSIKEKIKLIYGIGITAGFQEFIQPFAKLNDLFRLFIERFEGSQKIILTLTRDEINEDCKHLLLLCNCIKSEIVTLIDEYLITIQPVGGPKSTSGLNITCLIEVYHLLQITNSLKKVLDISIASELWNTLDLDCTAGYVTADGAAACQHIKHGSFPTISKKKTHTFITFDKFV